VPSCGESARQRVTVVLQSRSPNAYFSSLFAPALQHARETLFITKKIPRRAALESLSDFGIRISNLIAANGRS